MIKSKSQCTKIHGFLDTMKARRSNYVVENKPVLSDDALIGFVTDCLENAPSSFNYKTQRVMILFNDQHTKLWKIIKDALPPDGKDRINMFAKAYATILFFVDDDVVDRLAKAFPRYGLPAFADWELQANAMFQFEVWTGLSNLGYGVNIQHYNNLVQEEMVKTFGAPKQWKLIAEMPIGKSMGIYPKLEPYSKDVKVLIRK